MQAVKDMMADLNAMLAADARGEHTQEDFDEFMDKHGQFSPKARESRGARRLARAPGGRDGAHARVADPEQRDELRR